MEHYRKHGEYFFTNPITIGVLSNKYYIIDGQHRLKCIELLNFKEEFDVLVSLLILDSEKELDEKYQAINQNKPVPLPENIKINLFHYLETFCRYLEEYFTDKFSLYFSYTERPFAPNFNKDKLMKYINDNKIAEQVDNNYQRFIRETEELNDYYKKTYTQSMMPYFSNNIMKQIEKSKKKNPNNPLFLSIYKNFSWVDHLVYKINNKIEYPDMKHVSSENRIRIKKSL